MSDSSETSSSPCRLAFESMLDPTRAKCNKSLASLWAYYLVEPSYSNHFPATQTPSTQSSSLEDLNPRTTLRNPLRRRRRIVFPWIHQHPPRSSSSLSQGRRTHWGLVSPVLSSHCTPANTNPAFPHSHCSNRKSFPCPTTTTHTSHDLGQTHWTLP